MPDRDEIEVMLKQRKVLADLGEVALQSEDLDEVLTEACRLVGEALGTGRAKVLEIEPGGDSVLVRAGVGWAPDVVGQTHISLGENSSESYAIRAGEPVISQDIGQETRFDVPSFMKEAGVVALVNVPIFLPGRTAYGLLQVDDTGLRDFDRNDVEFLRTYATILGPVIDRLHKLQKLHGTEERYRAIVETARDYAIFTTDPEGRIETWPPGAQEILGWTAEEAIGLSMDMTFTPEDRAHGAPEVERMTARVTGLALDVRWHQRKDGSRVFIEGVMRPFTGSDGKVAGFVKVGQNVTERRAMEDALRESEERFRAIVETATDYAILTTDPEGLITAWPPGAQKAFGWSAEEAIGQPVDMTFTPEDRAHGAPETERITARTAGYAPDVRGHLRKDGSRVYIDGTSRPLTAPDGTLVGFVKVGQDVTERRATEDALRQSEARFRQFGDATGDVLWIRDAETLEFEYVSPAFEEVYGHSLEHILSGNHVRRWVDLIVPEDRDLALDHLRRVREGEHVLSAFRILHGNGQIRWIRDTGFPIKDEQGRVQRVAGIGHDATEEVELQDRLRVLVAELQHRSRNLVGVVQGVTERTLATSQTLDEFRTRIRARLAALGRVNSLLSRLENGDRITFDQLLDTELQAHGVLNPDGQDRQIRRRGPKGVRLRSATVQTFALALHELATNALKYGALSRPEGRLEVTWSLDPDKDGVQMLRVDWRESGIPVAAQVASSIDGTPVSRRQGYGRELIERALPYQLKAQTSYELTPEGVRCTIVVPVSSTLDLAFSSQEDHDA